MFKYFILLCCCSFIFITACTQNNQQTATIAKADTSSMDSNDCVATKYPNDDKPMALMMRQMADNTAKMKELVLAGKPVTADAFPFIRFHLVEPTDPDVLQPQFFENARLFQEAHKNLVGAKVAEQRELYTAYINQCINCHQTYCSGPLKRINKLKIN
jgi:hypothetical protein